jgi:glutamine synthetase
MINIINAKTILGKGDWNGSGMHTNFSTSEMRDKNGIRVIKSACEKLKHSHKECIKFYGHKLKERLSGKHETSDINSFSYGVADRGCSIRIPRSVETDSRGYLEDRRPGANSDPYEVASALIYNICVRYDFPGAGGGGGHGGLVGGTTYTITAGGGGGNGRI